MLARGSPPATAVAVGRFAGERVHLEAHAQRGIADHQRGVGVGEHGFGIGRRVDKFRLDAPVAAAEQARERDGAARVGVQRDAPGEFDGLLRQRPACCALRRLAATAIPGSTTIPSMRWYSMAGMMATSAWPARSASAQSDGTVKERS